MIFLLLLGDNVKRRGSRSSTSTRARTRGSDQQSGPAAIELPETEDFTFDEDIEIISDERGVRIARGEEAD